MIGNIFASMSFLFVASLLVVSVSSATPSTKTEADLVSVILAAIKGQNEMDSVARYLGMSRDALAKELPLETSGK
jgi:DNA-binding phage protein